MHVHARIACEQEVGVGLALDRGAAGLCERHVALDARPQVFFGSSAVNNQREAGQGRGENCGIA
jgi:hypothetical protein